MILIIAIAYLRHPENHISHVEENITEINGTLNNMERDEKMSKLLERAALSEYPKALVSVLLRTWLHLKIGQ